APAPCQRLIAPSREPPLAVDARVVVAVEAERPCEPPRPAFLPQLPHEPPALRRVALDRHHGVEDDELEELEALDCTTDEVADLARSDRVDDRIRHHVD